MAEFRKVHQFNVFSVNTPMQHALAGYLQAPAHYEAGVHDVPSQARPLSQAGTGTAPVSGLIACEGSYFQVADYGAIRDVPDREFCEWLAREHGVAAIPLSPFYQDPPEGQRLVRFCFAKEDATLDAAIERLCAI